MRKVKIIFGLIALCFTQYSFADTSDMMDDSDKPCAAIVKSCLDAGYTRDAAEGKKFWKNCMKPLLLGKSVADVKIDPAVVKDCKSSKIKEMKEELKEFQNSRS